MNIIDKHNLIEKIGPHNPAKIELGCGNKKKYSDSIGIDMLDYENVDIVGDVTDVLQLLPDNSISEIYSSHFFEHMADLSLLMKLLERVLCINGSLEIIVPHFSNPYFYSDYTHKTFFGLYTFCYFSKNNFFRRGVPTYNRKIELELTKVDLVFKSTRPFYVRHLLKLIVGKLVNVSNYTKEFYEENLCYLIPCYEIKYQLRKI